MVRRVAFGAALLLALPLSACASVGSVNPVSVPDPYSLSANSTTIDLTNVSGTPRFVGTATQTFADLPAGLLPPVPVTSYSLTLSIVGATVTGPTVPPATLNLTSPGATVTLTDPNYTGGVAIDLTSSATWTLQQTSSTPSYAYAVSGTASLVVTVTDASTAPALADVVSLTTQGGDNEAAVQLGVTSTDVPTGDTLTLEFGPGSAVYNF